MAGHPTARLVVRVVVLCAVLVLGGDLGLADPRQSIAVVPLCQRPFGHGEWGTDALVEVTLSRPPAMGQIATLRVEVCGKQTGPVRIEIVLPASFGWVAAPDGFRTQDRVSSNPANFGCLHVALGTIDLVALQPHQLAATVIAHTPGRFEIGATAKPETGLGDLSSAYLTVGRTAASSQFGFPDDDSATSGTSAADVPPTPSC